MDSLNLDLGVGELPRKTAVLVWQSGGIRRPCRRRPALRRAGRAEIKEKGYLLPQLDYLPMQSGVIVPFLPGTVIVEMVRVNPHIIQVAV